MPHYNHFFYDTEGYKEGEGKEVKKKWRKKWVNEVRNALDKRSGCHEEAKNLRLNGQEKGR